MHSGPSHGRSGVRPVVGICAAFEPARWSFWDQDAALVADTYLAGVRRAGGLPLVLAPEELEPADAETLLDRVDALLLIGGADVDPECYGAAPSPRLERTVPLRDRFELLLVRAAFERDLPVLGICRGLHILNVAAEGTLHQHLADEGFAEHRPAPGRLDGPTLHEVAIEPGTLVAGVAGVARELVQTVNSHHHQGVARVGHGGRVTARSIPDGCVEAVEWPAQRYALGVQWHPEAMELSTTIAELVEAAVPSAAGPSIPASTTGALQ